MKTNESPGISREKAIEIIESLPGGTIYSLSAAVSNSIKCIKKRQIIDTRFREGEENDANRYVIGQAYGMDIGVTKVAATILHHVFKGKKKSHHKTLETMASETGELQTTPEEMLIRYIQCHSIENPMEIRNEIFKRKEADMDSQNKIKCPACGSALHLQISFTGCDWNTVAGENSGYNYPLSLCCEKTGCGRVFTLGHIKNERDFSPAVESQRPYAGEKACH